MAKRKTINYPNGHQKQREKAVKAAANEEKINKTRTKTKNNKRRKIGVDRKRKRINVIQYEIRKISPRITKSEYI